MTAPPRVTDPPRVLGVDFGEKRIGLAVSDPLRCTAQGLETLRLERRGDLEAAVRGILARVADYPEGVAAVVVGLPVNMNGTEGPRCVRTRAFVAALRAALPASTAVVTWDERLTSVQAERIMREAGLRARAQKRHVDRLAAQLLLQSWMDAHPPDA